MNATTERRQTCRYLRRSGERCTGEVADPDPTYVQLCPKHLARALELLRERGGALGAMMAGRR